MSTEKYRYLHTMLRVKNLDTSVDFYTRLLGMKELRRREVPGMVAVDGFEIPGKHAADPEMLASGYVDLLGLDHPVVVAIDHVAGHMWVAAIHVFEDALLADDMGMAVGKHGGTTHVVPVAVTVDDVLDGFTREAGDELPFQPGREIRTDRIHQHDSIRSHIDETPPVTVAGAPEIAFDLENDTGRRAG